MEKKDKRAIQAEYDTVARWLSRYETLSEDEKVEFMTERHRLLLTRAELVRDLFYEDGVPYILDLEADGESYTIEDYENALRTIKEVEGIDIAICDMYEPSDCEGCCDDE